jgi:hypothetical protein
MNPFSTVLTFAAALSALIGPAGATESRLAGTPSLNASVSAIGNKEVIAPIVQSGDGVTLFASMRHGSIYRLKAFDALGRYVRVMVFMHATPARVDAYDADAAAAYVCLETEPERCYGIDRKYLRNVNSSGSN